MAISGVNVSTLWYAALNEIEGPEIGTANV
jgi:hypothetical protein